MHFFNRNKKRLYLAVYPAPHERPDSPRFHWALLTGPKDERYNKGGNKGPPRGVRYHVTNTMDTLGQWTYKEIPVEDVRSSTRLLVRLCIGKVTNEKRLARILRDVPVVQGDPAWRCDTWVRDALAALNYYGRAVGDETCYLDWDALQTRAAAYVDLKHKAGRYSNIDLVYQPKPTFDMMDCKEVIP